MRIFSAFHFMQRQFLFYLFIIIIIIIFLCDDFRRSVLQRDLDEADHLQSQAFHFVFCHPNLLAPVLHL